MARVRKLYYRHEILAYQVEAALQHHRRSPFAIGRRYAKSYEMRSIYSLVKGRALRVIPEPILRRLRSWHHRRVLLSFADSDEPDLVVVRKLVKRGTVAVDLGANIGVYTKALSELVGPAGAVISVEPVPQTFEALSRNVRSFGMHNVRCINAAVSDRVGSVLMTVPNYEDGGSNYYQASITTNAADAGAVSNRHLKVPSLTLDTIASGIAELGFVKCDIEGHELACLAGATATLGSRSAAWLIEVAGDPDNSQTQASSVFEIFASHSYQPWWFDGRVLVERRPGERSTNYFFLKSTHVAELRSKSPEFFVART